MSAVTNHFPGLPIVGYEAGKALVAARAQGFRPIGRLVVWLKEYWSTCTTRQIQ